MGLCKCRVVTNLFCFEHRRNVCEKCMLTDHPKCIVRSYLQWLQDSDYEAVCGICKQGLDHGELVRLCCLDVFHFKCLNDKCNDMPPHTAAAGYACPDCNMAIIPSANVNTPLAELVRAAFQNAKWAQDLLPKKHSLPAASVQRTASETMISTSSLPQTNSSINVPAVKSPIPTTRDTTVEVGVVPKKVTQKPSQSGLRDGDDDKYGRQKGWDMKLGINPRWLTSKRLILYLVIVVALLGGYHFFVSWL